MTPRKSPGQRSLLLVPEPMRADGYCYPCNANVRDIIRHRTASEHRARTASRETGAWLRSRMAGAVPPWARALTDHQGSEDTAYDVVTSYALVGEAPLDF